MGQTGGIKPERTGAVADARLQYHIDCCGHTSWATRDAMKNRLLDFDSGARKTGEGTAAGRTARNGLYTSAREFSL